MATKPKPIRMWALLAGGKFQPTDADRYGGREMLLYTDGKAMRAKVRDLNYSIPGHFSAIRVTLKPNL